MAQKPKAKTKTAKKTAKTDDRRTDAETLIGVCEGCLTGLKSGKSNGRQRWLFTKVAEMIRWAVRNGYPDQDARCENPFVRDNGHMGEITVRQLMEVVENRIEFPRGLDTVIRIGDVEGNNGTNGNVCLTCHRKEDVVLSIDPNEGDLSYGG